MSEPVSGITASTKRSPAPGSGRTEKPVAHLATLTLAFAPLPVKPEVSELYGVHSPRVALETGVMSLADVQRGDILTTGGVDYHVRAATTHPPEPYTRLILERVV